MGVIGYFMATRGMAKFAKPIVTQADVVLLIGNRTNQNGTDSWTLLPKGARYIHIDVDPMEIGRNYEALRLPLDADSFITNLQQEMRDALALPEGQIPSARRFAHDHATTADRLRNEMNDAAKLRREEKR